MMEKKRSTRSSPGIVAKSPLVYEKYQASCAWRLINFFDFRQGWSGKRRLRLLTTSSDKSHRFRDSAGNVYTNSQLDLLRKLHEKCQCTDDANARGILVEDVSCRPRTKRKSLVSGSDHKSYNPKSVREVPKCEMRRSKHLKEETFDSLVQAQGKVVFSEQKQSSSSEIEKSDKKKMNDEQLRVNKGRDQMYENLEKCAEINLHVCVNEVAETLICQKGNKGKGFGRDKESDRSKQFLEALDVLSSNKELFVTLLQDPNSFSAKFDQDLPGSRVAKPSSKAESFETSMKELRESDDLDRIVLLKPKATSFGEDSSYLRFKHLAKKLKLVVGSNKNSIYGSEAETTRRKSDASKRMEKTSDESDSRRKSDASTSTAGHRSSELSVFKRKKRVESDVFKLSPEYDVSPRRFMVERQHERARSPLPLYEVPHVGASPETRFKEKQRYRLRSPGKNFDVFNPKQHGYHIRSSDECSISEFLDEDGCRGSDMEDEFKELRDSQRSFTESCKDNHFSTNLQTNTLFSDISSPERSNSNLDDPKQELEEEHPSPVSVLARIHMEDDTASPGNAKPPSTEEEHTSSSSDPNIDDDLESIVERGSSIQEFVKTVLETSGLNWTDLLTRCTSESSLLNNNGDQRRLVLDYTREILHETYRQDIMKCWPFRLAVKHRDDDLLVEQAMKLLMICGSEPPRTLEEMVERDLTSKTCCEWVDLCGETECVVTDVVEHVLELLELEMVTELGTTFS